VDGGDTERPRLVDERLIASRSVPVASRCDVVSGELCTISAAPFPACTDTHYGEFIVTLHHPFRTVALLTGAALAMTGLVGSAQAADPTTTVTVRQGDLINGLSDTRSAGHVSFLGDGLAVVTDDSSSQAKAAEYFEVTGALPDTASLEWYGTQPQPGQQIVFDADGVTGNGNDYNILVGEPVYGDNWWLTGGSSADAKAADPSGTDNGGNGSEWFGTLAQWKAALPDARMYAGGFSLGSGVKGSGVLRTITYDSTAYRFTNVAEAAPVVETPTDVTGSFTVAAKAGRHATKVRVDLDSVTQPAGSVLRSRLAWKITVDGATAFRTNQQFDDHDVWSVRFGKHTGKHKVRIYKSGDLVRKIVVRTGS
jgi:hypothetical protein